MQGLPKALAVRVAEDEAGAPLMRVVDDVIATLTAELGPMEMPTRDPRSEMALKMLNRMRLSNQCVLRQDEAGEWWVAPA